MAKLTLKFEKSVLREFAISKSTFTIGRLPDNQIQVDNMAVSGHHAKIYWEGDHFVLEDTGSFNGTFVNNQRITKHTLASGDTILIGKHTLSFVDDGSEGFDAPPPQAAAPPLPRMDSTMALDTRKAREMLAAAMKAKGAPAAAPAAAAATPGQAMDPTPAPPPSKPKARTGVLSIISGKTDQKEYLLLSKLNIIGKSDMASVKLKGWFAPKVAAAINRREDKYFVVASEKSQKVKVNGQFISGQHELVEGDMIAVAKISATFRYNE